MKTLLLSLLLTTSLQADNAAVLKLIDQKCADCHSDGDEPPTLTSGINLASLLKDEESVKNILDRVARPAEAKGRMPKSKGKAGDPGFVPPLTVEEVAVLTAWAKGETTKPVAVEGPTGNTLKREQQTPEPDTLKREQRTPEPDTLKREQRIFIPLREEVKAIATDLVALDATLQPFTRYLTLTNLFNLRDAKGQLTESDDQMAIYRAGLSKLLNAISRAGKITVPVAIDPAKTIYRIDLRDYLLTAEDWEQHIARGYPYALRGIDGRAEADIEKYTHSRVGYLRADWFVFAASQPPLYHELLHLPATEQELEKMQGVDTLANLRAGRALRAGFRQSGVSQGNRLIERHEATTGMYWKSYDFTPLVRTGHDDLFRSPLGPVGAGLTKNKDREFQHDGGEFIFRLPNGLHAYLLATSDGKRIDRGPSDIVQDRKRRDGVIINGISCIACHDQGMKRLKVGSDGKELADAFEDLVGPVALAAGLDRDEARHITELHVPKEKLFAAFDKDEADYMAALTLATPEFKVAVDPVDKLYRRFKEDIRLETLAAEFGEQDATFLQRLKDSRDATLESLAAQFESGLGFPRANWLDHFKAIAAALSYTVQDFHPIDYAEFTSGAPKAGGNEGKVTLSDGGKLTITTNKADYKKGELLTVKVKSTEGVFLRLYHLSAEKVLSQIFPNSARTDNFLKGGETVEIGAQKQGDLAAGEFRFRMKEPFGTEIILAVASPVQFTDKENLNFAQGEVFKSFGTEHDLRKSLTRGTKGLEVEVSNAAGQVVGNRSAPTFTARAVFTVGP